MSWYQKKDFMTQYSRNDFLFVATATSMFVISPLITLPYIVYGVYRRYKGALLLFALFLGLWAYLMPPLHDLYRHLLYYDRLVDKPLGYITFDRFQMNGAIGYVYWIFANVGIPFEYARLLTTTIAFTLFASIWKYKMEEAGIKYTPYNYFMRFCVFFLFFDYYYTVAGVKFGFALALYFYGVHCRLDLGKYTRSFVLFFLSGCFHPSMFLLGITAFLLSRMAMDRKKSLAYIFITLIVFNLFFSRYGEALLGVRADWYLSENSTTASYSHMTTVGFVLFFAAKICALPFAYMIYKRYSEDSKWCKLALAWFVMSLAFLNNAVFFYRIWWGFTAIGTYVLLDLERLKGLTSYYLFKVIVTAGLCFFTVNTANHHTFVINSRYECLLAPVPYILSTSYTKEYVQQHVMHSGAFKE